MNNNITTLFINKILDKFSIDLDLPLENLIETAKSDISVAQKEAIDYLNKVNLDYKNHIDSPVIEPNKFYSIAGKQYDLNNFIGIDHSKYITKKENIISKKQSELSDYKIKASAEKRDKIKESLHQEMDKTDNEIKLLREELDVHKYIIDASLKYESQLDDYLEYQYRSDMLKKLIERWDKIVFIFSPEGPLQNESILNPKKELPKVPSGATVLSIKQPWALLIANNYKSIECRNWIPGKDFVVPREIYIHATKPVGDPRSLVKELQFYCRLAKLSELKLFRYEPIDDDFICGKIIAKAVLSEIIEFKDTKHYSQYNCEHIAPYPYFNSVRFGFKLINIEPVEPTPAKGKLLFWRYE